MSGFVKLPVSTVGMLTYHTDAAPDTFALGHLAAKASVVSLTCSATREPCTIQAAASPVEFVVEVSTERTKGTSTVKGCTS